MNVILSKDWGKLCTPRMGVARLTQMAFEGQDIRSLWHALMETATDDVAGSGTGIGAYLRR